MFYKKYKNIHYVQQVPEPWWLEAAGSVESRAVCTLLQKPPDIITINILLFLKVRDFRILCGKI
jgi:hypothetical protein